MAKQCLNGYIAADAYPQGMHQPIFCVCLTENGHEQKDIVYLSHTSELLCPMQGLIMLEKATGKVIILASQVSNDSPKDPGSVINYANDLDVAKDGTVYFTTSCDIPVVPNALGFWDTFAVFTLTMLQVRLCLRV